MYILHRKEIQKGPPWSWSYGSWIYNYLCNQYLSLLKCTRCTWYNFMQQSLSVACDRLVVFSWYSDFIHQKNLLTANYSETRLNQTLNKTKSCINPTLSEAPLQEIFVKMHVNCINQKTCLILIQMLVPRMFDLARFHFSYSF